jgi:phosphotransacetylase
MTDTRASDERAFQAAAICRACEIAAIRVSGLFEAGCRGCIARGVGRLPQYRAARDRRDSRWRPYVQLLEHAGVTHEEVREAVRNDREHHR